ncbi:MAG: hypothetical protein HBSAPP03_06370 [Phycisphaerae bacterium]|nr:MAG: hypothetical protein HBSAPP03_06370 [Phycisphaerae bacterium]
MKPFRARSAAALYEAHHGPNMTPMVDVVMVILIFFMASAAILGPEWFLKSALPVVAPTTTPPTDPPARLRIVLDAGDVARVALDDAEPLPVPLFQVEARLRDELARRGAEGLVVLVEPTPNAPYDAVVRVHEWCAAAGITKVGLAGQRP